MADWSGNLYQDRRSANKYGSVYGQGGQTFVYHHEEDESSFQLVDTARIQKPQHQRSRGKYNQQKIRRDRERREERRLGGKQQQAKGRHTQRDRERRQHQQQRKMQQYGRRYDRNQPQLKPRAPSVPVSAEWEVINEIEFSQLAKLNYSPEEPEELHLCGSLGYYDVSREKKISLKTPQSLQVYDRVFHKVTTTDDPVIRRLVKRPSCSDCKVFATDAILATLMTCGRSKYSWDIVVQRVGDHLFFDKRDDSQFDFLTVSETAKEPPQEESGINSPPSLAMEATYINQNFSQQTLVEGKGQVYRLKEPNPFAGEESGQVASVAYRYMKWRLKNDVGLVVRCEYDALLPTTQGRSTYINIKALNEWDPKASGGIDWRKKLDSQRGAVLATELKNNSCKIAKWAMTAILAGSSFIKFGYVSRIHHQDSSKHEILGVQQVKPLELAQQMTLDVGNAWGVLHAIIDTCREQPPGKYLILKDPNKPVVRIYKVPMDAFEGSGGSEDESEEASEEEEEEDEGRGET